MAEVNLTINGRVYGVACDDGQEARVQELAQYVDERLKSIARAGAASNESHLLVLTSLVLADEVFDLLVDKPAQSSQEKPQDEVSNKDQKEFMDSLDKLALRISKIADKIAA